MGNLKQMGNLKDFKQKIVSLAGQSRPPRAIPRLAAQEDAG